MFTNTKICTICWRGSYNESGVCENCGNTPQTKESRGMALPEKCILNNRYVIGHVLGHGGYGITYSAWDIRYNRRVAIKELFPLKCTYRGNDGKTVEATRDGEKYFYETKEKFRSEAELLRLLENNSNIVKVYDIFQCHNTVYYSMEYLDGCDLNKYRKNHTEFTWDELKLIVKEVLQALGVLHKQNLIHRDISPDNIFLTKDNQVWLIDFGSARTYKGNDHLTIQTKEYFAPMEQLLTNGRQGPWTDIYALSVTMYLLLTKKLPPVTTDRYQGIREVPLGQLRPDLPSEVIKAIEKGMDPRPERRFQTVEEYMYALDIPYEKEKKVFQEKKNPSISLKQKQSVDKTCWLYGRQGVYAGRRKKVSPDQVLTFGRGTACVIAFPSTVLNISRRQCELRVTTAVEWYVKDSGSSYGTFLNGKRLEQNWTRAKDGDFISFGDEVFQLIVT